MLCRRVGTASHHGAPQCRLASATGPLPRAAAACRTDIDRAVAHHDLVRRGSDPTSTIDSQLAALLTMSAVGGHTSASLLIETLVRFDAGPERTGSEIMRLSRRAGRAAIVRIPDTDDRTLRTYAPMCASGSDTTRAAMSVRLCWARGCDSSSDRCRFSARPRRPSTVMRGALRDHPMRTSHVFDSRSLPSRLLAPRFAVALSSLLLLRKGHAAAP